jgi:type I restriction enzyme M protein
MIDASEGFEKDGPKNRLRPRDMHKIVDAFTKQLEISGYARMVPLSEIENAANDFNLNIPRYIDSSEPEDIQDLHAHIHGGIPQRDIDALKSYWTAFPSLRRQLFRPLREGYVELAVDKDEAHATIAQSAEYQAFSSTVSDLLSEWWIGHRDRLAGITNTTKPAGLIGDLSEDLLDIFHPWPLVDEYAVYEQLMSYWNQTMHDDVALIMSEGWDGAASPRKTIDDKERKLSETPDIIIGSGRNASKYKIDLIPPSIIVARFFPNERAAVDEANAKVELTAQSIADFIDENSGDDGLLADAMDDGNVSKALASIRLREAKREDPRGDEVETLTSLIGLYDSEAAAKKFAKDAISNLDTATLAQYGKLSASEIRELVLADKWGAAVQGRIRAEVAGLIERLIERIHNLAVRYEATLGDIQSEVASLAVVAEQNLAKMGVR